MQKRNIFEPLELILKFLIYNKYFILGADGLGLQIQNLVDIEKTSNFELAMRLSTNINSTNEYFTDLNGYQVK